MAFPPMLEKYHRPTFLLNPCKCVLHNIFFRVSGLCGWVTLGVCNNTDSLTTAALGSTDRCTLMKVRRRRCRALHCATHSFKQLHT